MQRTKPLRGGKDPGLVPSPSATATRPTDPDFAPCCTQALRRGILQRRDAWRQARPLSSLSRSSALFPKRPPCPSIQSTLKAIAVPIAASSSAFVSTRPTRPGVRPRLVYGLADTRFCKPRIYLTLFLDPSSGRLELACPRAGNVRPDCPPVHTDSCPHLPGPGIGPGPRICAG